MAGYFSLIHQAGSRCLTDFEAAGENVSTKNAPARIILTRYIITYPCLMKEVIDDDFLGSASK